MPRPLLLVTVALTLAAASLASLPAAQAPSEAPSVAATSRPDALDVRRRFVDPSSCCEVDPDMCRGPQGARTALTRTSVLRVVALHRDEARACLNDTSVARARVRWRVGSDGRPHEVVVTDRSADGVDERAAACLTRTVSAWRFPATAHGLKAPITFAFAGPRGPTR